MKNDINKFKSGFVALIGRPNAGKSTLLNALIGKKVSICTSVSQTTRNQIAGVLTTDNMQAVIIDTPGIHKPNDALGEQLNATSYSVIKDVDIIICVVDTSCPLGRGDEWVFNCIQSSNSTKICLLNKCDVAPENLVNSNLNKINNIGIWNNILTISAKKNININSIKNLFYKYFKEGPLWYPRNQITGQQQDAIIIELIREQFLKNTLDEIPHSIGLELEQIKHYKNKKLYKIYVNAYCEKKSQISIVVGSCGNKIKLISSEARKNLESYLGEKVFLDINICLAKNWRKDLNKIRKFGYMNE